MTPRSIIHVNPDDFHASILRVKDPSLRGKALLIAEPGPRSRLLACSYEARSEGVRRDQRIEEARRLCPRGLWVPPDPVLFRKLSWRILRFLTKKAPRVEAGLSGEAYLDVTGCRELLGPPEDLAQKLRREIRDKFSVEASAGLASNKLVSLGASIEAKKAGMVDVFTGYEAAFFEPWPLFDFPGVSENLAWKFRERSVSTAGDLARLPREWLEGWLGPPGLSLWVRARGEDHEPVRGPGPREAVRLSRLLEPEILDREVLLAHSAETAADLGRVLRRKIIRARRLALSLSYADGKTSRSQTLLEAPSDSDPPLIAAARALFLRADQRRILVSGISLEASGLEPGVLQGELWNPETFPGFHPLPFRGEGREGAAERARTLSRTRDSIRRRFKDPSAIFWGSSSALFSGTYPPPHGGGYGRG